MKLRGECAFLVGDTAKVLSGKYVNRVGTVLSFDIRHNPVLYVLLMGNGKEIAVFENEIERGDDENLNG